MSKRKLRAKAPEGYVWCKDMWLTILVCDVCRKRKKCVIIKSYQEAQVDGQDVEKGKNNKGK